MKKIKLPHPMKLAIAGLGAFLIADIINPGFHSVAVILILFIPILLIDLFYPQEDALVRQIYEHKKELLEASMATDQVEPEVVN